MKMNTNNEFGVVGIFQNPVYYAHRNEDFDLTEEKEIEDIVNNGQKHQNSLGPQEDTCLHGVTVDSYIFNTKLKKTKEFCEYHIKQYVKEIINPKEEDIELYITQSWLNVLKPGGTHQMHIHPNSVISGVFYVNVNENDGIWFYGRQTASEVIKIKEKENTIYNSDRVFINVKDLFLLLFPSSMEHSVEPNNKATTDRISISFNTFVKGKVGDKNELTDLIFQ